MSNKVQDIGVKNAIPLSYNNSIYGNLYSISLFDYILFVILIQSYWIGLFLNIFRIELYILTVLLIIVFKQYGRLVIDKSIIAIFFVYAFLAIVQGIKWDFSIVSLGTSFTFGFLLTYYLYIIYKQSFFLIIEKVIFILTVIATIIWLLHQFIPGIKEVIENLILVVNTNANTPVKISMFFYTYWSGLDMEFGLSRNAGFTSEPAGFSGFIILGIIINFVKDGRLFTLRQLIYYLAILTTISTTGYLALSVLSLLLLKQKRQRVLGVIIFPVFIFLFSQMFTKLEFMQEKIELQYQTAKDKDLNEFTNGRFFGARKSLYVLAKYPLIGRGLLSISRPESESDPEATGYGWLAFIARFGVVFGAVFLFFFFKGLYNFILHGGGYGWFEYIICLVSVMIYLSSMISISAPYFLIFFYLGVYNYKERQQL